MIVQEEIPGHEVLIVLNGSYMLLSYDALL